MRAGWLLQRRREGLDHEARLFEHEPVVCLAHSVNGVAELQVRELELLRELSVALRLDPCNRAGRLRLKPSGDEMGAERPTDVGSSAAI